MADGEKSILVTESSVVVHRHQVHDNELQHYAEKRYPVTRRRKHAQIADLLLSALILSPQPLLSPSSILCLFPPPLTSVNLLMIMRHRYLLSQPALACTALTVSDALYAKYNDFCGPIRLLSVLDST